MPMIDPINQSLILRAAISYALAGDRAGLAATDIDLWSAHGKIKRRAKLYGLDQFTGYFKY